jgi:pyrimidine operon attenuation protein/uracil phosphoribosyltransferase
MKTKLLDESQTLQKIKRIAYQIYESNFEEKTIVLAGIDGQGFEFAKLLLKNLNEIAHFEVIIANLSFDKQAEIQPDITIKSKVDTFKGKVVVLVDDVLNTGKTLAYCFKPFLNIPLKKFQVAVLVDRNYPKYPIAADFIGYSLSTTLTEHVKVVLNKNKENGVYLF